MRRFVCRSTQSLAIAGSTARSAPHTIMPSTTGTASTMRWVTQGEKASTMKRLFPGGVREFLLVIPTVSLAIFGIWNMDYFMPNYVVVNPELRQKLVQVQRQKGSHKLSAEELAAVEASLDPSIVNAKSRQEGLESLQSYTMAAVKDSKGKTIAFKQVPTHHTEETEEYMEERPDLEYEAKKA